MFLRSALRLLRGAAEVLKDVYEEENERAYTLGDHRHHKRFTASQGTVSFL
jgi:hypothetical protein